MTTKVAIFNRALVILEKDLIISPTLEDDARARLLEALYLDTLDAVLRAHPWNCARVRRVVSPDDPAPAAFEFAYTYTLPTDPYCLRVLSLWNCEEDFQIEGRKLLTNAGPGVNLKYIARVVDPSLFDANLAMAVSAKLAYDAGPKLNADGARIKDAEARYAAELDQARSVDGQEGTPEDFFEDDFLDARL
jgi:hypothetical protein